MMGLDVKKCFNDPDLQVILVTQTTSTLVPVDSYLECSPGYTNRQ